MREPDKTEQKRLYTLLREDQWQAEPFLHRQMRDVRRAVTHSSNMGPHTLQTLRYLLFAKPG